MDYLKEAFQRVRQDISSLNYEVENLKVNLAEINWRLVMMAEEIKDLKNLKSFSEERSNSYGILTKEEVMPAHHFKDPASLSIIPTDKSLFKPLEPQIYPISIGNEGVPTDRQTNQQTNQQTENSSKNVIQDAAKILDSLDNIKKEIRLKFKRLTEKETLVFSTIYQLEEEKGYTDYKSVSERLNLTESSIRDYVGKLISKGIPVDKNKINNKTIHLLISKDLKKIAPLNILLKLREL